MKYFITLILGLLAGVALALAGLYFNPLTQESAGEPFADPHLSYVYTSPVSNATFLSHGGGLRVAPRPSDAPKLWEDAITDLVGMVMLLGDSATGTQVVASRLAMLSEQSNLLTPGVRLQNYWIISLPGEGSLFAAHDQNLWPMLKGVWLPAWYDGAEWTGSATFIPAAGPRASGAGHVIGATGHLAGRRGSMFERYTLRAVSAEAGPRDMLAEVAIQWEPQTSP